MSESGNKERAVIYIRVSTDRQVIEGASLQTQERDCLVMCARNGWDVMRIFREEGESAKTADRPQLQELLKYCAAKPRPHYVVVHHVDRWARSGTDHDMMRNYLCKLGVKLRSFSQQLGEDPYEQFFERIMSGQAELDNKLRGLRSLEGMKTRLREGRWPFKAPLGYVNGRDEAGGKTLILDPTRAPLIKQVFELYATAMYTKEQVRERMNAEGLTGVNGKPLSPESFDRMLQNPCYAGILKVEDWDVSAEGKHAPLISRDLFERVQEVHAGRRVTVVARQRNHPDFPLRNFVRCGNCCKPLTASWSKGKMGTRYAYYRCQNRKCVSPENARRQDVESGFIDFLRRQKPDPAYLKLFHRIVLDVWNAKQADAAALIHKFDKRVDDLKERKKKLNEAFVFQQKIDAETYQQMHMAIVAELAEAELALSRARIDEIEVEKVVDFAENLLLNPAGAWQRCSLEQKQRLQQVFFPKGVLYADGSYRTHETSFLFKGLSGVETGVQIFGSANGNRTRV